MNITLGTAFDLNAPLPAADFEYSVKQLKGPVASNYLDFMRLHNGGEGPVGEESYLALFRLEDIPKYNERLSEKYSVVDYTVFASNGGNAVFAFNQAQEIIEFDLIGLEIDEAITLANCFAEFIAGLS